jgi:anti-sigma factor RsiW
MSCKEMLPLLSRHADAAVEGDERELVESHLVTCAKCRDQLALLEATALALKQSLDAKPMPDFAGFADKVLARAHKEKAKTLEQSKVWTSEMFHAHRAAFAGIAAGALAACAALAFVFTPPQQPDEQELADNSPQVEEVDFGTHDGAVLQLPGQTTVIWMSDDHGAQQ